MAPVVFGGFNGGDLFILLVPIVSLVVTDDIDTFEVGRALPLIVLDVAVTTVADLEVLVLESQVLDGTPCPPTVVHSPVFDLTGFCSGLRNAV